jgi:hypothetical protein
MNLNGAADKMRDNCLGVNAHLKQKVIHDKKNLNNMRVMLMFININLVT